MATCALPYCGSIAIHLDISVALRLLGAARNMWEFEAGFVACFYRDEWRQQAPARRAVAAVPWRPCQPGHDLP